MAHSSDGNSTASAENAAVGEARGQMKAAVREVTTAAGDKAEELAQRGARAGADTVAAIGRSAETLATSLQDQSPAVAEYVRSTGKRFDRLADDLRDKSAGELLSIATEFGRKQPLILLAGAAVVGFALSRIVKSGLATEGQGPGADVPSQGRIDV